MVTDIQAARALLIERGVEVSEPFHFGAEGQTTGLHPERADYGTFMFWPIPTATAGWSRKSSTTRDDRRDGAPGHG